MVLTKNIKMRKCTMYNLKPMTIILLLFISFHANAKQVKQKGELILSVSKNFQNSTKEKQEMLLYRCTDLCNQKISKDINGDKLSLNKKILLRPGNYALALTQKGTYASDLYKFEVRANRVKRIRLPELNFSDYHGKITLQVRLDLDKASNLSRVEENNTPRLNKIHPKFPLKLSKVDWSNPFYTQQNEQWYYHMCKSLIQKNELPELGKLCREVLQAGTISGDQLLTINNFKKLDSSHFSIVGSSAQLNYEGCTGYSSNSEPRDSLVNNVVSILEQNPGYFAWPSGAGIDYGVHCTFYAFKELKGSATTVNTKEGKVFLLTPGKYYLNYENESGDQSEEMLEVELGQDYSL